MHDAAWTSAPTTCPGPGYAVPALPPPLLDATVHLLLRPPCRGAAAAERQAAVGR